MSSNINKPWSFDFYYFQDSRSGKSCSGSSYCENPQDYPGTLILNLLKTQTFPRGLFDEKRIKKINVDLISLIPKDIVSFLSKHDSEDYEISNLIDDELSTNTTKVMEPLVNDNKNEEAASNETLKV